VRTVTFAEDDSSEQRKAPPSSAGLSFFADTPAYQQRPDHGVPASRAEGRDECVAVGIDKPHAATLACYTVKASALTPARRCTSTSLRRGTRAGDRYA
jgi:hypothetical protein